MHLCMFIAKSYYLEELLIKFNLTQSIARTYVELVTIMRGWSEKSSFLLNPS